MSHCYKNPDPDYTPSLTQGNVVFAIRDFEAERMTSRERWPRAVDDEEFCNYVAGLYMSGNRDKSGGPHKYKEGVEIRCQNRNEAEHLDYKMREGWTTTVKYSVTYYG